LLSHFAPLTAGVMGVDALGIGLGGGFGGWGGAFDGNLAGDAVTLFADMKEQQMAQV
jgi:F0F1-type ATP synthase membrane subunit c/vacuolar-type H+-ATPase subunit K